MLVKCDLVCSSVREVLTNVIVGFRLNITYTTFNKDRIRQLLICSVTPNTPHRLVLYCAAFTSLCQLVTVVCSFGPTTYVWVYNIEGAEAYMSRG